MMENIGTDDESWLPAETFETLPDFLPDFSIFLEKY